MSYKPLTAVWTLKLSDFHSSMSLACEQIHALCALLFVSLVEVALPGDILDANPKGLCFCKSSAGRSCCIWALERCKFIV